jgi:uncharacterized protein
MTLKKTYEADVKVFKDSAGVPTGQVEFYASVFGNVDLIGDRVMPGAFDDSLTKWREKGDPLPIIFSHDWGDAFSIIGYANPSDVTPDEKGLRILGTLDINDNPTAKQIHRLMDRRVIKEASFAYDVVKEKSADDGANDLLQLDLIEVGPCLKGMNPATGDLPTFVKAEIQHIMKEAGDATVLQTMHDAAVKLGASCADEQEKTMTEPEVKTEEVEETEVEETEVKAEEIEEAEVEVEVKAEEPELEPEPEAEEKTETEDEVEVKTDEAPDEEPEETSASEEKVEERDEEENDKDDEPEAKSDDVPSEDDVLFLLRVKADLLDIESTLLLGPGE